MIFFAGNFDDFDSILVEIKNLVKMTGTLGRTQQKRLCMISGNRNGLIGMATIQAGFGGGMASKIPTLLFFYMYWYSLRTKVRGDFNIHGTKFFLGCYFPSKIENL